MKKMILIISSALVVLACGQSSPSSQDNDSNSGSSLNNTSLLKHHIKPGKCTPESNVLASWYGPGFHGRKTASGEVFNQYALTAAHKTLPFGTKVKVCYKNQCVTVRINDRGPFSGNRKYDLSMRAAEVIGFKNKGVARVSVQCLN